MEFFDLKEQYKNLKAEIDGAVLKVLEEGVFIGGPEVENFEREAARFLGAKHALGLNSGTDALYLALKALGVGAGDEAIVPDFTFIATAEAVAQCGARPVFCDIDSNSFNIDPCEIEKKITKKTKAIIPVHLFGRAAEMDKIMAIARENNLFVIEDAAQAFGAKISEKRKAKGEKEKLENKAKFAGTIGDIGCFSFFPTKNLGAFGDGGMIAADNDQLAAKIKLSRAHGSSPQDKYLHSKLGVNSRLDAIQAAILAVKLKYANDWNAKRIAIAKGYNDGLAGVDGVVLPEINDDLSCVFHQYAIRTPRRDELKKYLAGQGIPSMVYYPRPLHLQPAFAYLGHQRGDFPRSEAAAAQILNLPIFPELVAADQQKIINSIKQWYFGR